MHDQSLVRKRFCKRVTYRSYLNTPDGAASFFSIDKTPEERSKEPPKVLNSSQQELGQSSGSRVTGGSSSSQLAERSAATHATSPASPLTPQQKGRHASAHS
jgi:hypothetical protein